MTSQLLSAHDFIADLDRGEAMTIIDLRTPAEYGNECLDNCIHLPLQDLTDASLAQVLKEHKPGEPVYLLCQSGKRADMAVQKLAGTTDVSFVILSGGLNAIKEAGANIKKGRSKVMSLERQVRIAAGVFVMIGVALGFLVHPNLFLLSGFVGAGLTFAGITDTCAMGMLIAKMPWNK